MAAYLPCFLSAGAVARHLSIDQTPYYSGVLGIAILVEGVDGPCRGHGRICGIYGSLPPLLSVC